MDNDSSFGIGEETLLEIERQEREVLANDLREKAIMIEESPKETTDISYQQHLGTLSCRMRMATQRQCDRRKQSRSRGGEMTVHTPKSASTLSISKFLESNEINLSEWEKSIEAKLSPAIVSFQGKHEDVTMSRTPICEHYDHDNVTFIMPTTEENNEDYKNATQFIEEELTDKSFVMSFHNESVFSKSSRSHLNPSTNKSSLIVDTKKNLRFLKNWNLPLSIVNEYRRKGIEEMFHWQCACLQNQKVLFDGANLIYSAPTSAGKTFVSEILMIKNILERKKKVLFILPFVSVVREKIYYLQELLTSSGIRVDGYYGGYQAAGGLESLDLIICTIEKANSIVNRLLLEQNKLDELGMIVIDEIHLIADPSRGYILELLLTKVLFMCLQYHYRIQLIGMSATLPNVDLLCTWLKAELYETDYRPIDLIEMIKIDKTVFDCTMKSKRLLTNKWSEYFANDVDDICELAMETVTESFQLIIFCPSKEWCEQLSTNLARGIHKIFKDNPKILENIIDREKIEAFALQGKSLATGIDQMLETCVKYAVAYHHAGLTTDERDLVEMGFKAGIIKALVATSTLSSGVNLPARRVIIRTPMFGNKIMSNLTYRQMIGRAGRKGRIPPPRQICYIV
jgi:superfamily II helicase